MDFYGESARRCYTLQSPVRLEMAIVWRKASWKRRLAAPVALNMLNRIERECLRRSNIVTALSQFTIDCISSIHGSELARSVRLTPGWCETRKYVPIEDRTSAKISLGWPTDVPVLFTLRRLVPRMGLDRLIQACGRLRQLGLPFRLMIGGSGSLRSELEQLAASLGLSDRVTFLGRLDDDVLPIAYGACDAFVLPTAELECFGLIALEALAAGRPVLATPVGSIPEIVGRFEPAWLARSAAIEDIAGLIQAYLRGTLPEHSPEALHEQTHREFGRWRLLPELISATFEAPGLNRMSQPVAC